MRFLFSSLLAFAFSFAYFSPAAAFTTKGFAQPYGIVVDAVGGFIYVSNVNGAVDARDNNGFISRLKKDGTVDQLKFIDGASQDSILHAPKGMAIIGNLLYVADLNAIKICDLASGKPQGIVEFEHVPVKHLYGLIIGPDGALYTVDEPENAIYRVDPTTQKGSLFLKDDGLGGPHGIAWHSGRNAFLIAGWGKGELKAIDLQGKRQPMPNVFVRTMEGVSVDAQGNVYLTSFSLRGIYKLGSDFAITGFQRDLPSPVALAFDGNTLLVTIAEENSVRSFPSP